MAPISKPLNFALVGCGRVSARHVEAILSTPGARVSAVSDIKPERAARWSRELGVPAYASIDDLLNQPESIDVVCILTPSGLHADHSVAAARAGKHVLVEKPMALNVGDADRMIAACEAAKVHLFVVKQLRYSPAIQKLRRALDEGLFGKLVLGTIRLRCTRTQEYYDQDPWRGTWAMDGGVLANQGSHYIDLLQWMMGPVESVSAMTATRLVDIEAEDTAVATLKFAGGALGIIEATSAARPANLEASLSTLGERGTAVIAGAACNNVQTWSLPGSRPGDDSDIGQVTAALPNHRPVIENIIKTLHANEPPLVDGYEGRKSLAIIEAIYKASQLQSAVQVPRASSSR